MQGIVFLLHSPLVKRDFERFGIELLQNSFKVYVFDMTCMYRPEFFHAKTFEVHSFDGYRSICTMQEFLSTFASLDIHYAVDFLNISPDSFFIRKKLKKAGVHITKLQSGLLLKIAAPERATSKIKQHLFGRSNWRKFFFTVHKLLFPKTFFASDSILLGGLAGQNLTAAVYSDQLIPAHSFDYDIFLRLKDQPVKEKGSFAVFIDQAMINHPNYKWLGIKPFVTQSAYYGALESFFADFESKTGMQVLVAAHPRAKYDQYPTIFKRRKLYYGITAELIRDSQVVLQHVSTSISYAILWKKPMIFLTTDEINGSLMGDGIHEYCKFFSLPALNMNRYTDQELTSHIKEPVNEKIYQNYIDQFLCYPGSPEKYLWEIYSDYLQKKIV